MLLIVCRPIVFKLSSFRELKAIREHFGHRIRELRSTLGLSQEQLADAAGLHRTYIGSVERGERNVSLQNIVAIARALNVTPSILFNDIK